MYNTTLWQAEGVGNGGSEGGEEWVLGSHLTHVEQPKMSEKKTLKK